jgi:hypothetical protein
MASENHYKTTEYISMAVLSLLPHDPVIRLHSCYVVKVVNHFMMANLITSEFLKISFGII